MHPPQKKNIERFSPLPRHSFLPYICVQYFRQSWTKMMGHFRTKLATAKTDSLVFRNPPPPSSMLSQPKDIQNLTNFNIEMGARGCCPMYFCPGLSELLYTCMGAYEYTVE